MNNNIEKTQKNLTQEEKQQLIKLIRDFSLNIMLYYSEDSLIEKLKNEELAKKILINNEYGLLGNYLYKIKDTIENDQEIIKEIYQKDKETVKSFCNNWKEYSKLDKKLRNEKEILLNSLGNNGWSLFWASEELKNDKELVLKIIKKHYNIYDTLSKELKNDREIVLEVVKCSGSYLKKLDNKYKNDREIVYEALLNLKYIDKTFKDKTIEDMYYKTAKTFFSQNQDSFTLDTFKELINYMSKELNDKIHAIKVIIATSKKIPIEEIENLNKRELFLEMVKLIGLTLEYAPSEIKNDKEIVLEAVKHKGNLLQYASEELQNDEEVVLEAIKQDITIFSDLKSKLKQDKTFLNKIIEYIKENQERYFFYQEEKNKLYKIDINNIKEMTDFIESVVFDDDLPF